MKCEHCPLKDSDKPCPSAENPSYCRHVIHEIGMPFGYWTTKLLKQAEDNKVKATVAEETKIEPRDNISPKRRQWLERAIYEQ